MNAVVTAPSPRTCGRSLILTVTHVRLVGSPPDDPPPVRIRERADRQIHSSVSSDRISERLRACTGKSAREPRPTLRLAVWSCLFAQPRQNYLRAAAGRHHRRVRNRRGDRRTARHADVDRERVAATPDGVAPDETATTHRRHRLGGDSDGRGGVRRDGDHDPPPDGRSVPDGDRLRRLLRLREPVLERVVPRARGPRHRRPRRSQPDRRRDRGSARDAHARRRLATLAVGDRLRDGARDGVHRNRCGQNRTPESGNRRSEFHRGCAFGVATHRHRAGHRRRGVVHLAGRVQLLRTVHAVEGTLLAGVGADALDRLRRRHPRLLLRRGFSRQTAAGAVPARDRRNLRAQRPRVDGRRELPRIGPHLERRWPRDPRALSGHGHVSPRYVAGFLERERLRRVQFDMDAHPGARLGGVGRLRRTRLRLRHRVPSRRRLPRRDGRRPRGARTSGSLAKLSRQNGDLYPSGRPLEVGFELVRGLESKSLRLALGETGVRQSVRERVVRRGSEAEFAKVVPNGWVLESAVDGCVGDRFHGVECGE